MAERGNSDHRGCLSFFADVLSGCGPSFPLALSRADLVCHWEDSDVVAQEMFANVRPPTRYALATPFLVCPSRTRGMRKGLQINFLTLRPEQDSIICICVAFAVRTI